jgi:hypothetical protein
MTIREYIQRRVRLLRIMSFGWVLLLITLFFLSPRRIKSFGVAWILLAYVTMLTARYVIAWQTKCPRCRRSLRQFTLSPITPHFGFSDSCPHCGVSLDELIDRPANRL